MTTTAVQLATSLVVALGDLAERLDDLAIPTTSVTINAATYAERPTIAVQVDGRDERGRALVDAAGAALGLDVTDQRDATLYCRRGERTDASPIPYRVDVYCAVAGPAL